jgi:hypothetical protein
MVMSLAEFGTKNEHADEGQLQFTQATGRSMFEDEWGQHDHPFRW